MTTHFRKRTPPSAPSEADRQRIQDFSQQLAPHLAKPKPLRLQVLDEAGQGVAEPLTLPLAVQELLVTLLAEMSAGHAVRLVSDETELTTQEAADLLNVSRPFLIDLMEKGEIPYRKVGTHRRTLLGDVMAYKQRSVAEREAALNALVAQAQEEDMGY
jgi:excisionase family DNA binding protein